MPEGRLHGAELSLAGAGQLKMDALHSKYEVLRRPMQAVTYSPEPRSGSTGFYSTHPVSVGPWPDFALFVSCTLEQAYASDDALVRTAQRYEFARLARHAFANNEAALNSRFLTMVGDPITEIGAEDGSSFALAMQLGALQAFGVPDFNGKDHSRALVLGEGKDTQVRC